MKTVQLFFFFILITLSSCQPKLATKEIADVADSFMPMQIGNFWKMAEHSYTEIQDTLRIDHKLYYKFYSLIGGDAVDVKYLRLDENNQLLEAYPGQPGKIYTHAKFNLKVNQEFYTLSDGSENDYKVKVSEKTPEKITFEFFMLNHPKLKESSHKVSYIRGLGLDEKWKSVVLGGKVIK